MTVDTNIDEVAAPAYEDLSQLSAEELQALLPHDLIQRHFVLRVRTSWNAVLWNTKTKEAVALYRMNVQRLLLVSSKFGVVAGFELDDVIRQARKMIDFIEYVNRKNAEALSTNELVLVNRSKGVFQWQSQRLR